MFSSKSKDTDATASVAQQARRPARSAAPSIISADLVVQGTLTSTGDIQIDGRVEGDVRSAGLVIGDKAFIQGEILADDVTVRGRVQGGIRARKVLLWARSSKAIAAIRTIRSPTMPAVRPSPIRASLRRSPRPLLRLPPRRSTPSRRRT